MSKHINVNPDHYKVAGRDRLGNAVAKAKERAELDKVAASRWERRKANSPSPKPKKEKGR
jgi:hypothetical protein